MTYFCPQNMVAGFQERTEGKLAFLTYVDPKNKQISSAKSWETWRDTAIEPLSFENVPRTGFVINKNIKRDSYFGGNEYLRVWHPLGFEFEIDVSNFERVFNFVDTSKGEILTPCVLGWSSRSKVQLISTLDPAYQGCIENPSYDKVNKQDLVITSFESGKTYDFKGDIVVCLGHGKVVPSYMPFYTPENIFAKTPLCFYNLKTQTIEELKTRVKHLRHSDYVLNDDDMTCMKNVVKNSMYITNRHDSRYKDVTFNASKINVERAYNNNCGYKKIDDIDVTIPYLTLLRKKGDLEFHVFFVYGTYVYEYDRRREILLRSDEDLSVYHVLMRKNLKIML